MPEFTESQWGRWNWKGTGLGRWHAIAEPTKGRMNDGTVVTAVRLACGRVRTEPNVTAPRPNDDAVCCPECLTLDNLRKQFHGVPVKKPQMAGVR